MSSPRRTAGSGRTSWSRRRERPGRARPPSMPSPRSFGLGIRTSEVSDEALQRLVVKTSSFLDIMQWRERLAGVERQVARISYAVPAGTIYGTGFLVGPSALLTNYHVIKAIVDGKA